MCVCVRVCTCVCVLNFKMISLALQSFQGSGVESVQPHHSYLLPAGWEDVEGEAREGATQSDTITEPQQSPVQVNTHTDTSVFSNLLS